MDKLLRAISYNSATHQIYLIALCLVVIIIVMIFLVLKLRTAARKKETFSDRLSPGGFDIQTIKTMEKMGQLDDEELKRIKQRMADQYLDDDAAEKDYANKLPLEMELEKAEMEAKRIQQENEKKKQHEKPKTDSIDPLDYDFSLQEEPEQKLEPEPQPAMSKAQAELIRKHLDLKSISLDEAENFHKMGVISKDELESVQNRDLPIGNVSAKDIDASKLSREEIDEMYHIGVLTRLEYEALKEKMK